MGEKAVISDERYF